MQGIDEENIPKGKKGEFRKTLGIRSRSRPTMRINPSIFKRNEGKRDAWYNSKLSLGGTKPPRTCTFLENKKKKGTSCFKR